MGLFVSRPRYLHCVDKYEFCRMVLKTMEARPHVKSKLSCVSKDTYSDLMTAITDSYIMAVGGHPTDLSVYVIGTAEIMSDDILDVQIF